MLAIRLSKGRLRVMPLESTLMIYYSNVSCGDNRQRTFVQLSSDRLRTLFVADEKTIRHVPHGCAFRVIMAEATSRQLDDTGDFGRQQNPKP